MSWYVRWTMLGVLLWILLIMLPWDEQTVGELIVEPPRAWPAWTGSRFEDVE